MVGHSDCNKCCNNQQSWQNLCGDPCSCLYRAFPLCSTYLINLNLNLNFPFMILSSVNLVYISERKFLLSVRFRWVFKLLDVTSSLQRKIYINRNCYEIIILHLHSKNNYLGFEDKIIFSKKHIGHCCFGLFFSHKKLNIKNTVVPLK